MKIKHIVLSVFVSTVFWGAAQAQTVDDALIFSKEEVAGSARTKAMGNVHTSLGGDLSSINGNPAGLGFFGRSDIGITFNYLNNKNNSNFQGKSTSSSKGNFGVDQAGAVFYMPTSREGLRGWQNFNVGISYNKTQNFNNRLTYDGDNNTSSIANAFTDIMSGDFQDFLYNAYIVEEFADNSKGFFPLSAENVNKNQYNEIITENNRNKTALSFGANYNNSFYIGATLGITSFRYTKSTQFIENGWTKNRAQILANNPNSSIANPHNSDYDFVEASYELFDNFTQSTEGSALDVKLGMIFKPTTDWNIGVTINTPSWTTVKDQTTTYTDIDYYDNETAPSPFESFESDYFDSDQDYRITSPWKFALGASKFFGRGLLSADVEYVTYNTMKYNSVETFPSTSFDNINKSLKDTYQGVVNLRLGGEYLVNDIVSARAGFNYFGNPYKNVDDKNYSGSVGIGFKLTEKAYLDLSVVHQVNSYRQAAYVIDENFWGKPSPIADIDHNRTSALLTIGTKF